jgi:hypothetical protein
MFGVDLLVASDIQDIIGVGSAVTGIGTDFIAVFDAALYEGFLLNLNGTFSLTLQAQFTNDLAQPFVPANVNNIGAGSTFSPTMANAGLYYFNKSGRYLRIRCSAFTSNTSLVGILECLTMPLSLPVTLQSVTLNSVPNNLVLPVQPIGIGSGSGLAPSGAAQTNVNGTATAATATATLAGVASRFSYVTAMEVTIISTATAGSAELSLTGLAGGTVVYEIDAPGVASTVASYLMNWGYPGLQSSAVNTSIVATLPTLGAGTGKVSVVLHGYTL